MWLIDTTTYELRNHSSPEQVDYVILSHTWGDDEVSFQDMKGLETARQKACFTKIEGVCNLAREVSVKWAWVDTCCIDKSSSAELTESINFMFRWYKDASVCITYLEDLKPGSDAETMKSCKWFTRGWTLQEMIAARSIDFYDESWSFRGSKRRLADVLSRITGVDAEVLEDAETRFALPVGRRMSWAAERITTRIEDRAYSLLGIFDVNMPLIYGEGEKAFLRLQETIARETDDLSLLAWVSADPANQFRGVFAQSPLEFQRCHHLIRHDNPLIQTPSFTVTNKGLQVDTSLDISNDKESQTKDYALCLYCTTDAYRDCTIIIRLVKTPRGFVRHRTNKTFYRQRFSRLSLGLASHIILKRVGSRDADQLKQSLMHSIYFQIEDTPGLTTTISPAMAGFWDEAGRRYLSGGNDSFVGIVELTTRIEHGWPVLESTVDNVVICGFVQAHATEQNGDGGSLSAVTISSELEPWAYIFNRDSRDENSDEIFRLIDSAKDSSFALIKLGRKIREWLLDGQHDKLPTTEFLFHTGIMESQDEFIPAVSIQLTVETKKKTKSPEYTVAIKFAFDNSSHWESQQDDNPLVQPGSIHLNS